jgi:hypothetical protein
MMKSTTHVSNVAAGWAAFEMLFDRSTFVERSLRKLAATKTTMQIGVRPESIQAQPYTARNCRSSRHARYVYQPNP